MHVLVTGGCGYIGSALVPTLQRRDAVDRVTVLDSLSTGSPRNLIGAQVRNGFDFYEGDVREYGDVETAMRAVDAVVHLAAITGADSTHDRREETVAVNLDGSENVFDAAAELDVETVVYASSCNVYGGAISTDIDETVSPDPINPYAEAKLAGEELLVDHVERGSFDGVALRLATNYGYAPGIRFNLVVNHFVFRALTGRTLTIYGDGSNWRPFVHVRDAAAAFADAVCHGEEWPAPVYNVGTTEENYRIREVAEVVAETVEPTTECVFLDDEHPGPSYHVSFERLAETGFETEWTLREGIRDLTDQFTDSLPDY